MGRFVSSGFKKRGKKGRLITSIRPKADPKLKKIFQTIGIPDRPLFSPDPFQLKAVSAIKHGDDCLVCAPTGSGKTWIAEQAISRILEKGGKSWYASPLKALSNSKYNEFSEKFGSERVGILTGDLKENPDAPVIVGTTEILRNQLYDAMHRGVDLSTDFVILDEAHYLGDADRGVVWEETIIYLPGRIPLLLLSATIGNAKEISGWISHIRNRKCTIIQETKRPVPLYPVFIHPTGTLYPLLSSQNFKKKSKLHRKVADFIHNPNQPRLHLKHKLPPLGSILKILKKFNLLPAIFFLKSRADCNNALELCEDFINHQPDKDKKIAEYLDDYIPKIPYIAKNRQMAYLVNRRIGAHHSGQLPAWRMLLENLMTRGLIDAVFATSTVAAGVNFPARTVVFLNSDQFNGTGFMPLTSTQFLQMTGRAGRRGMDKIGFAAILPGKYMDTGYLAKLFQSSPADIISQIKINFSMTLNLLLSHTPEKIEILLKNSFATYLINKSKKTKKKKTKAGKAKKSGIGDKDNFQENLLYDFVRHFDFLVETGFAKDNGTLTEDGIWASRLRVDQPLLIAQGIRRHVFPASDPGLLAAVIASFVNDRDMDDRLARHMVPKKLEKIFIKAMKELSPFMAFMIKRDFCVRPVSFKPALMVYLWATGTCSWENILYRCNYPEGDLAMLILRTADHLRHITSLSDFFPVYSQTASKAIELLLRSPVVTDIFPA